MKAKKILALLLALCLVFAFAACSSTTEDTDDEDTTTEEDTDTTEEEEDTEEEEEEEEEESEPLTIAYSCISYSLAPLTQALGDNLQEQVEAQGWTFNMLTAEGDTELQGEQISQLIAMDPDYLLIMAGDATLAADWLEEAAANDVTVIAVHIELNEEDQDNALCYVGVDTEQIITAIYDYMVEQNPDTELNIVQVAGVPTQADYINRIATFEALVEANDNLTIIGDTAWAYSSRADAQTLMEEFINTYGDQIDVVMGYSDNLTLGAVAAIEEAGLTDQIQVYSVVYHEASYDAIASGEMVTVFTSTGMMAERVIECIQANEAGEEVDYVQTIECPVIDASNVDDYEAEY